MRSIQKQGKGAGESIAGARPRGSVGYRAGGSGSDSGSGDGGGQSGGESGNDGDELTAAEADQIMSAAEQRLQDGMLGGPALPESGVGSDESGGGGDEGGGNAGAGGGEGHSTVDVGVEVVGDVARGGAGLCSVACLLVFWGFELPSVPT